MSRRPPDACAHAAGAAEHTGRASLDVPIRDAHFDPDIGAWMLSRYSDVAMALRDARLVSAGLPANGEVGRLEPRGTLAYTPSPERLSVAGHVIENRARDLVERLPTDSTVDLVRDLAAPFSRELACHVTGASPADGDRLAALSREIFLDAACTTNSRILRPAREAAAELAIRLNGVDGSFAVQSFVALTQTLPCLLAGAWLALLRHPGEARRLRDDIHLMPHAVEELLRHAGPSRAVFRRAAVEVRLGCARIGAGERVILMIASANRDPQRFPAPDRLDIRRTTHGHLAFGAGTHSCPGAGLIRMAVAGATEALLRGTSDIQVVDPIEWIGGFAIRAPGTLPAVLLR